MTKEQIRDLKANDRLLGKRGQVWKVDKIYWALNSSKWAQLSCGRKVADYNLAEWAFQNGFKLKQ